jgi:hypothetical protein
MTIIPDDRHTLYDGDETIETERRDETARRWLARGGHDVKVAAGVLVGATAKVLEARHIQGDVESGVRDVPDMVKSLYTGSYHWGNCVARAPLLGEYAST